MNEMRKTDCELCADLKFISLEKLYNHRWYHYHFSFPDLINIMKEYRIYGNM